MDAYIFAAIVIHRHKHSRMSTLNGHRTDQVSVPHNMELLRNNRAIMSLGAMGMVCSLRRLQAMLSHQPADMVLRGANTLESQPGPDLTVAIYCEPWSCRIIRPSAVFSANAPKCSLTYDYSLQTSYESGIHGWPV